MLQRHELKEDPYIHYFTSHGDRDYMTHYM